MKFKPQEGENQSNSFLQDVISLLNTNKQFWYAIKCAKPLFGEHHFYEACGYSESLIDDWDLLMKLAISLNPEHKEPALTIELVPVDSITELKKLEEKYYNILKEVGNNAMEANDFEVVSYLSEIIRKFRHFFCTLNESDSTL